VIDSDDRRHFASPPLRSRPQLLWQLFALRLGVGKSCEGYDVAPASNSLHAEIFFPNRETLVGASVFMLGLPLVRAGICGRRPVRRRGDGVPRFSSSGCPAIACVLAVGLLPAPARCMSGITRSEAGSRSGSRTPWCCRFRCDVVVDSRPARCTISTCTPPQFLSPFMIRFHHVSDQQADCCPRDLGLSGYRRLMSAVWQRTPRIAVAVDCPPARRGTGDRDLRPLISSSRSVLVMVPVLLFSLSIFVLLRRHLRVLLLAVCDHSGHHRPPCAAPQMAQMSSFSRDVLIGGSLGPLVHCLASDYFTTQAGRPGVVAQTPRARSRFAPPGCTPRWY